MVDLIFPVESCLLINLFLFLYIIRAWRITGESFFRNLLVCFSLYVAHLLIIAVLWGLFRRSLDFWVTSNNYSPYVFDNLFLIPFPFVMSFWIYTFWQLDKHPNWQLRKNIEDCTCPNEECSVQIDINGGQCSRCGTLFRVVKYYQAY